MPHSDAAMTVPVHQEGGQDRRPWAVILAGGEGTRLRPLVRQVCGDERPKQYAPLLGSRSLLRATLDRVGRWIPRQRTVVVTSQWHSPYVAAEFAPFPDLNVLVQPLDRGTAAGLLLAVDWVRARDPGAILAVFPSDHFFANEPSFMRHVEELAAFADRNPDRIVLVGAPPSGPETGFGWIEPAEPLGSTGDAVVRRVRRFWEKPAPDIARACLKAGCLWNTFVMVGCVTAFVEVGRRFTPRLHEHLLHLRPSMHADEQEKIVSEAYAVSRKVDFSRSVMEARPAFLAVSELPDVGWSDWGTPERVLGSLGAVGISPSWLTSPGAASETDFGFFARSRVPEAALTGDVVRPAGQANG